MLLADYSMHSCFPIDLLFLVGLGSKIKKNQASELVQSIRLCRPLDTTNTFIKVIY